MAILLRGGELKEIQELKCAGLSVTGISRKLGIDRKTVRKYLDNQITPIYGPRAPRPPVLAPHLAYVKVRLSEEVWNAVVLFKELRERGYSGGYTTLTNYLRPKRKEAPIFATRRFETAPGKQAQVDWGHLGKIAYDDKEGSPEKAVSSFVMTLGSSRAMFSDAATDQTLPTLLAMHEAAFAHFGGIPEEILYDNMKTVVLQTLTEGVDERGEIRWNPTFRDFARYWGFNPRLCRPYRPKTKGKVESGVKYVKYNFLCGRSAVDLEDLRKQLAAWVAEVANKRKHGTTHRIVEEAWQEEKPHLQSATSRAPYQLLHQERRRVSADGFVDFRTNRYPISWKMVGKEVDVHLIGSDLHILQGGLELAVHLLNEGRHQVMASGDLHKGMPFVGNKDRGKPSIVIHDKGALAGLEVEQRSLEAYAEASGCSGLESAV